MKKWIQEALEVTIEGSFIDFLSDGVCPTPNPTSPPTTATTLQLILYADNIV